MDLRRNRGPILIVAFLAILGALSLRAGIVAGRPGTIVTGVVAILLAAGALAIWRRPLTLRRIDDQGLHVHLGGKPRIIPWHEIHAVIADQPTPQLPRRSSNRPELLLVPVQAAFGVALDRRSPVDDRPCLRLLDLGHVRNTPEQVGEALRTYGDDRFIDRRSQVAEEFNVEFGVVLRGYDTAAVDALIRDGQTALATGSEIERLGMRAKLERAQIPVAMRGYDRVQVDATLARLAAGLAIWPGDKRASQ